MVSEALHTVLSYFKSSGGIMATGNRWPEQRPKTKTLIVKAKTLIVVVSPSRLQPKKMAFKRYVEIGRVALVNFGKDYGKLVVIVDVVDQNRALVDAPDMERIQMNLKRLSLTDIVIDINRVPKKKILIEAMEKADVKNKWEKSSWGRKLIVQKRRAALNDFDRFQIMLAKIKNLGLSAHDVQSPRAMEYLFADLQIPLPPLASLSTLYSFLWRTLPSTFSIMEKVFQRSDVQTSRATHFLQSPILAEDQIDLKSISLEALLKKLPVFVNDSNRLTYLFNALVFINVTSEFHSLAMNPLHVNFS
ncbi:unnamed protein product [Brassica oleracea var. botrytis]